MQCIQCEKIFKATAERQLFHSSRCKNKWREERSRCFYCGVEGKLERDHIYAFRYRPVEQTSRRDGDETVPACRSCNRILNLDEPPTILERFDLLIARFSRRGPHHRREQAIRRRAILATIIKGVV